MKQKILQTIKKYNLIENGDSIVIGVSGGPDSMCLLHVLNELKNELNFKIHVAHINHMIRGEEALRDEFFCKNMCKKYGVKFLSFRVDIPLLAEERKQGLEETAREERYRIFNKIISQNGDYKCIVTAHNANDNAETVIFNFQKRFVTLP
mgnify:CR=1 FL=1